MAQTDTLASGLRRNSLNLPETTDYEALPGFHRLGLVYGLLIGLGIALGFWLPKLIVLARLPLWFPYGGAIASGLAIVLLCGFTGWLTSRLPRAIFVMLLWLATAVLICVILGYLPPAGGNWAIWLADGRFANLPIYRTPDHLFWWFYVIGGFLLIILLTLMGVLQNINLGRAYQEIAHSHRLNLKVGLSLMAPAMLAGLAGGLIPDLSSGAPRDALVYVDQGIQGARSYDGDLFQFSRDTGFNYNALASVIDQISGPYSLQINEIDINWSSALVTAHFENGAWVNCRVNIEEQSASYLSFCFDAEPPLTEGLSHLLQGTVPPETCRNCEVTADATWQRWLQERASLFDGPPEWQRVAQHGRFTFMQATAADNSRITCQLEGSENVQLISCEES